MTTPPKKRRVYETLTVLWATCLGLTLAVAFGFQQWVKYKNLIDVDLIHFVLSIVLTFFSVGLFIAYMTATIYELNLLKDYITDKDTPRIMPKTYLVGFGLAIVFGALIALSDNLLIYSAIIVSLNLFDFWGVWQVLQSIAPALDNKKINESHNKKALQIIKAYYFDNPMLARIVTLMFINWIVVCLSVVYYFNNISIIRNIGYILVILNISIGELIILRWRMKSIYKIK